MNAPMTTPPTTSTSATAPTTPPTTSTSAIAPTTLSTTIPTSTSADTTNDARHRSEPAPARAASGRSTVPAALDAEWSRLRRHPGTRAALRRWGGMPGGGPLASVAAAAVSLDDVLAATRPLAPDPDGVLVELVRLAPTDPLAGRVVVQRLVPLLLNGVGRYRSLHRSLHGDGDPIAEVIAATWIVLRRYDTDRRCGHVASRLASDAMWEAFRRESRRRRLPIVDLEEPDAVVSPVVDDPLVELVGVLDDARRSGVPDADLTTLRDLVRLGSVDALAARDAVTPRAIRYRRDRAVRRVRAALGVAVEPTARSGPRDRPGSVDRSGSGIRAAA